MVQLQSRVVLTRSWAEPPDAGKLVSVLDAATWHFAEDGAVSEVLVTLLRPQPISGASASSRTGSLFSGRTAVPNPGAPCILRARRL